VQEGDVITINWGDTKSFDRTESKMRMLDECQMAEFYVKKKDGSESEDSTMYVKDDARCKR